MWNPFKKETRSQTLDQLIAQHQVSSTSGINVNTANALSLPRVKKCIDLIAQNVASLPIDVYKANKIQKQSALAKLLSKPNSYQTAYEFKELFMRDALTHGDGFIYIEHNTAGAPIGLHILPTMHVQVKALPNYRIGYTYTQQGADSRPSKTFNYNADEVIHLKNSPVSGSLTGISPISQCKDSIGESLANRTCSSNLFANGLAASFVLQTDMVFKDNNAVTRLKKDINDRYSSTANKGGTMILENGLKISKLDNSSVDSELLASRQVGNNDIAEIFNIPLGMFADQPDVLALRQFYNITLKPWLKAIEELFNSKLIYGSGSYVAFDSSELLKASPAERFEAYGKAIGSGVYSINEARAKEGLEKSESLFSDECIASYQTQAVAALNVQSTNNESS
jgi:HK97 family phage portal protein